MIKQCTLARLSAALLLALASACGGDDDDPEDGGPFPDGASMSDAGTPDAAVVDCSGDHRESEEATNNPFSTGTGAAERTGLGLAAEGAGFWVCGQLDPAQAIEPVADYDAFEFTVEGNRAVNLRIEMLASQAVGASMGLELYRVPDGPAQEVATGIPVRNGVALIAGLNAAPGRYWVSAVAWRPPELEGPVGYAIRVSENQETCPAAMQMPDHVETGDGPDSSGNDIIQIHLPRPPALTKAEDIPEEPQPPLILEPDAVRFMRGQSGAVETDEDSYLDRDTYLLSTGPTTSEVELRLNWPDDGADLDMYLFAAGDPAIDYSSGLGTDSGVVRDELMTLNVDPGADYWLWVGAYDDPQDEEPVPVVDYEVTLCPRAYVPPTPPK